MTQQLISHGVDKQSITAVLLYVPPSIYLDRLSKRNKDALGSGNLIEAREPLDMFTQYPEFYAVRKSPKLKLEFLTEKKLRILLERAYKDSETLLKTMNSSEEEMEYLRSEKITETESTVRRLGFDADLTEGYLTPRYQGYTEIINTGVDSPEEAAKKLGVLVRKKQRAMRDDL